MEGYTPEMWQTVMESKFGEDEEEDMEDGGQQVCNSFKETDG